jgi:hypothetical protein
VRGGKTPKGVFIRAEFSSVEQAKAFREKLVASGALNRPGAKIKVGPPARQSLLPAYGRDVPSPYRAFSSMVETALGQPSRSLEGKVCVGSDCVSLDGVSERQAPYFLVQIIGGTAGSRAPRRSGVLSASRCASFE